MRWAVERWLGCVGALAGLLATAAASPQPVVTAWSTYLRSGPGETYAAVSELEHDTPVRLAGCQGRWCRVSTVDARGFVDRDALDLPRTAALKPPGRRDCVTVEQADDRKPIPTRFCSP